MSAEGGGWYHVISVDKIPWIDECLGPICQCRKWSTPQPWPRVYISGELLATHRALVAASREMSRELGRLVKAAKSEEVAAT